MTTITTIETPTELQSIETVNLTGPSEMMAIDEIMDDDPESGPPPKHRLFHRHKDKPYKSYQHHSQFNNFKLRFTRFKNWIILQTRLRYLQLRETANDNLVILIRLLALCGFVALDYFLVISIIAAFA